jgi:hypothetical protein
MPWSTSRVSLPYLESCLGSNFHILQVEDKVFVSYSCDLLLYPSMQVLSFEYIVPRVLVSPCIKFDKIPRRKT